MAAKNPRKIVSETTGRVTYRARFSYTGDDGTRRHRSRTFPTRKEAADWLTRQRHDLRGGTYTEVVPETLAAYAERWFARMERRVKTSTVYSYRSDYRRFLEPAFGAQALHTLTGPAVQALYDDLLAREFGAQQIARVHQVLHQLMKSAVADGHARANPCEGRTLPRISAPPRQTWTTAQLATFSAAIAGEPYAPIYVTLALTGLRLGEALALQWPDVDLEARRLTVRATLRRVASGAFERAGGAKSASANRTVLLAAPVIETLRIQRAAHPQAVYVFPDPRGGFIHPTPVQRRLRALCDRAGVPRLTPHGLRHTAATLMMESGVPVKVIQEQLGHKHIGITLGLYAHVTASLRHTALTQIDALFTPPTPVLEAHASDTDDD